MRNNAPNQIAQKMSTAVTAYCARPISDQNALLGTRNSDASATSVWSR